MPERDSANRLLLAVAAPNEARAILGALKLPESLLQHTPSNEPWTPLSLSSRVDLLVTGVGKANAAGGVARALGTDRYRAVLNLGIAGSLPSFRPNAPDVPVFLSLGSVVLATSCVHSDEGVQIPGGFTPISDLGFPIGSYGISVPVGGGLFGHLRPLVARMGGKEGPIATVSTCSGTDARARAISGIGERVGERDGERVGACPLAEGMEGAAVAHVAWTLGVDFAELRVISNTTGDREKQVWDFKAAFAVLGNVAKAIVEDPLPR